MNLRAFIWMMVLLGWTSLGLSQEEKHQSAERKINEIGEDDSRIMTDAFPNKRLAKLNKLSGQQRKQHRIDLFAKYLEASKDYNIPINAIYSIYHAHIHPDKINDLMNLDVDFECNHLSKTPYKDHAIWSEVILVGRVRKLTYNPDGIFRTSVHIKVEEYLRDDFGLESTDEVILKQVAGPVKSADKKTDWVYASNEETSMVIGMKYIFYLSRWSYIGMRRTFFHLRGFYDEKEEELASNVFYQRISPQHIFGNSKVRWFGIDEYELQQVKKEIREVVRTLDVEIFFNNN